MTREQLEHVIRAAAEITGDREIVVVGSTSILGQFPNAPLEMSRFQVRSRLPPGDGSSAQPAQPLNLRSDFPRALF